MLRTLIIEDEHLTRSLIVNLVKKNPHLQFIGEASSVEEGIVLVNATSPDLLLMDIQLNGGTGFDILERTNTKAQIIFITAYQEFAIKALKLGAIDYLLKPIDSEEFQHAIGKVNSDITIQEQYDEVKKILSGTIDKLILKTIEGIHIVTIEEIMYLQSNGSYTHFNLSGNRNIIISKNIKEYENILPEKIFARCHNSFLVNLKQVVRIDKDNNLILRNGQEIPVSTRKRDAILEQLLK